MTSSIKTIAVLLRPFQLSSFNETLPPGEYEIETQLRRPVDWIEPGRCTSSILLHVHPRAAYPRLGRTLNVPLAELANAVAKEKLTGKALTDYLLEEFLSDPMIRLAIRADRVDESDRHHLYSDRPQVSQEGAQETHNATGSRIVTETDDTGLRTGSGRPGIGE